VQHVKSHQVEQLYDDANTATYLSEAAYLQEEGWYQPLHGPTIAMAKQDFIISSTTWGLMNHFIPEQPLHAVAPGDVPTPETLPPVVDGFPSAVANKGPMYVHAPRLGI